MEKKNVKMATIIFLFIYSIVALGKIQSNLAAPWWDNDYIYAGYVTAIGLASIAVHIKQRAIKITNGVKIVIWIISYVFLWGFIFIDFRFKSLISDNRFKMLYFIIFVSATAFWVNRLKCFKNFLKITYLVEVGFLLICFWLYRQKGEWIANLLTFFIGGRKEKIGYGGNANITGSLCFLAILMGNLLLEYASNITW